MRNCLILGSGRSGTSMVGGMFHGAGYYMGDRLYAPRGTNPKGFFEDRRINSLNEKILAPVMPKRPRGPLGALFRSRPATGQRWLAELPLTAEVDCPPEVAVKIEEEVAKAPYCFKDPRFCYTLPAWRALVGDAVLVCVFREPARTARSIVKECSEEEYLSDFKMDYERAVGVWTLMYRHIVEKHRHEGEWVFLHYDQALDGSAVPRLEAAVGSKLDATFPDPNLKRSSGAGEVPDDARRTYEELCELAGYIG
ncbi:MAG: hypothetical protein M3273_06435 [Actinomycetota bacterium]|nr:hypothetical protein [Actinomycetota bacterium]